MIKWLFLLGILFKSHAQIPCDNLFSLQIHYEKKHDKLHWILVASMQAMVVKKKIHTHLAAFQLSNFYGKGTEV